MVTWIIDFEWDSRVNENADRIYVDTLDSALDAAGYIAQGTGLSVIGFHAGCFLIAGDILRKLGAV